MTVRTVTSRVLNQTTSLYRLLHHHYQTQVSIFQNSVFSILLGSVFLPGYLSQSPYRKISSLVGHCCNSTRHLFPSIQDQTPVCLNGERPNNWNWASNYSFWWFEAFGLHTRRAFPASAPISSTLISLQCHAIAFVQIPITRRLPLLASQYHQPFLACGAAGTRRHLADALIQSDLQG